MLQYRSACQLPVSPYQYMMTMTQFCLLFKTMLFSRHYGHCYSISMTIYAQFLLHKHTFIYLLTYGGRIQEVPGACAPQHISVQHPDSGNACTSARASSSLCSVSCKIWQLHIKRFENLLLQDKFRDNKRKSITKKTMYLDRIQTTGTDGPFTNATDMTCIDHKPTVSPCYCSVSPVMAAMDTQT